MTELERFLRFDLITTASIFAAGIALHFFGHATMQEIREATEQTAMIMFGSTVLAHDIRRTWCER